MIQTREQKYAAIIYDQVESVKEQSYKAEYKSMSEKLPVLIHSAGLVQALYFAHIKAERLVEHLAEVVENRADNQMVKQHTESFLKNVREAEINDYVFLTEKCLLALKWYKRFSKIHLEGE